MPKGKGPVEQCSCGRWYPVGGAALCAANRHGEKEAPCDGRPRHTCFLEFSVESFCTECGMKLSASTKLEKDGRIVSRVFPHICPVPEPEASPLKEV